MADVLERLKAALADRYQIERELGSGGMATVYLAEDVKHHRKVAVKVLRPELAAALGPERFHREIEIAANLTHPHILPLHDSGDAEGFLYYVMPHIEGESLRDKLAHEGELPIAEAVRILRDVVDALSEAHEKGVVHRDIKPDNVLLTKHHALVTDFGVAKALSEATSAQKLTTEGVALGTPAYMSPEQAAADSHIDHRADIYAVGVVAYELLTGRPPFLGTTPQMILSAHMTDTPEPVTKYRETVPPALAHLVMRCLEKKAADRWQSAEELLPQLEALATPSGGMTPTGTMPVDRVAKRRWMMVGAVAGVAAIAAIAVLISRMMTPSPITITTSNMRAVTSEPRLEWQPALSPDGSQVAFIAQRDGRQSVVIKSTRSTAGGGELTPTHGVHDSHEHLPAWSPDGESVRFAACDPLLWLALRVECTWMETGRLGGSIRTVNLPTNAGWPSGSPDGTRVAFIAGRDSIFTYSMADGTTTLLAAPEVGPTMRNHSPVWSPDGRWIAYVHGYLTPLIGIEENRSSVWIVDADGGKPVRVTGERWMDMSPAWLDDDHLLFVSDHDGLQEVYVVEVGPTGPSGELRKVPRVTDVHSISYSIAARKLAFSKVTVRKNVWSYPIGSRAVSISDGHPVTSENAVIQAHDISADGMWIVYSTTFGGNMDIYKRTVEGGNPTPIAVGPAFEGDPRWSPDGTEIAFHRTFVDSVAVMVIPADGGTPVQVASAPVTWLSLWSPSGLELAFTSNQTGQYETWVVSREAIGGPWGEATQVTAFGCLASDWAPDGSGVLCTSGGELLLVSREGEVLWRYDPAPAGLAITSQHQVFSRDGSTIYAAGIHDDGSRGIWAIPRHGGEPSLVVAFDDTQIVGERWLVVGPDRLYLTVRQAEADIWVADVEVER
jgi:Tol biopolymer transport system component/tRNA A-37 threonylcarbamoyl transferase component Bud32